MASRYYGVNVGQVKKDVVEGSSSNTTGIELVVDLTKVSADGLSQREILIAIEAIRQYVMNKAKWPPA